MTQVSGPQAGPAGSEPQSLTSGGSAASEPLEVGPGVGGFDKGLVRVQNHILEVPVSFLKMTL